MAPETVIVSTVPVTTPMEALVAQMMLEKISAEARDKLFTDALANLLRAKEEKSSWGGGTKKEPSPLSVIFDRAVYDTTHKLVREKLATDPEIQAQLEAFIRKAISNLLASEAMAEAVADYAQHVVRKVMNR